MTSYVLLRRLIVNIEWGPLICTLAERSSVMVRFSVPNSYTNYRPNKLPLLLATWCKTEYYY